MLLAAGRVVNRTVLGRRKVHAIPFHRDVMLYTGHRKNQFQNDSGRKISCPMVAHGPSIWTRTVHPAIVLTSNQAPTTTVNQVQQPRSQSPVRTRKLSTWTRDHQQLPGQVTIASPVSKFDERPHTPRHTENQPKKGYGDFYSGPDDPNGKYIVLMFILFTATMYNSTRI